MIFSRNSYDLDKFGSPVLDFLAPYVDPSIDEFTFLGSGVYANVYDLGTGLVVRMSHEVLKPLPVHPAINQRVASLHLERGDHYPPFSLEIFPKVDELLRKVSWASIDSEDSFRERYALETDVRRQLEQEFRSKGIKFYDLHGNNVGRKFGGPWVVIDSGCFTD